MKLNLRLTKGLFLFVTPLVTGSIINSPVFAATLASSQAEVNISNFSYNPLDVQTITNTNTVAIASNGQVTANADAQASFIVDPANPPTIAFNTSSSIANGNGSSYFGLAQSFAGIIGYNFLVGAGETLSFDFNAVLDLNTSIDNPPAERATADGNISLELFDTTDAANWRPLDFFTLLGNLTTSGGGDFLKSDNSTAISFSPKTSFEQSFGGNQEKASASVYGKYSRTFNSLTKLTLVEAKNNQVTVKVPESSNLLGLLLFSLICLGYGMKTKVVD
jgi:hypothetical protein